MATNYCYKSCGINWIVKMEKLPDTITNENRKDVVNKLTAKFRANKLKVTDIFNKFDNTKINEITNSCFTKQLTYKIGEIVVADNFDPNIDNVCSSGIHYFNSIDPCMFFDIELTSNNITNTNFIIYETSRCPKKAMEHPISPLEINPKWTGQYTRYDENGELMMTAQIKDNIVAGITIY